MTRPLLLKKRHKFGAIRSEYGGVMYDSKREAAEAYKLDMLKAAGEVLSWERQVVFDLKVCGELICRYRADFVVKYADGMSEILEVKGHETEAWKIKESLFRAIHPSLTLRVVS